MDQPDIDLNYCSDPEDMRRLMAGVRFAWKGTYVSPYGECLSADSWAPAEVVVSDERLAAYIRANIGTYCHASGTVPIGPECDTNTALDQNCKVRGTASLYVADASIFPRIPSAVPNLTVMAVAERVRRVAHEWAGMRDCARGAIGPRAFLYASVCTPAGSFRLDAMATQ